MKYDKTLVRLRRYQWDSQCRYGGRKGCPVNRAGGYSEEWSRISYRSISDRDYAGVFVDASRPGAIIRQGHGFRRAAGMCR